MWFRPDRRGLGVHQRQFLSHGGGDGSGADVGKYTGMYYFFSMGAQVFTPIFSGVLLEHISYRTLVSLRGGVFAAVLYTMLFVRHGDVKPQKKASVLENFDVDDG